MHSLTNQLNTGLPKSLMKKPDSSVPLVRPPSPMQSDKRSCQLHHWPEPCFVLSSELSTAHYCALPQFLLHPNRRAWWKLFGNAILGFQIVRPQQIWNWFPALFNEVKSTVMVLILPPRCEWVFRSSGHRLACLALKCGTDRFFGLCFGYCVSFHFFFPFTFPAIIRRF